MVRHITSLIVIAASVSAAGCKKKSDSAASSAKGAEAPKEGCGSDYADPAKQFCVKLPAGYAFEKANKEDAGTRFEFKGPEQYFSVLVWSEPTFTYDYQINSYGPLMQKPDHTDVKSGGTPGQTQWWTYKFGTETPMITALAKSASGMAIQCEADGNPVPPEVLEACKTLRPYPGGAAAPAPAGK